MESLWEYVGKKFIIALVNKINEKHEDNVCVKYEENNKMFVLFYVTYSILIV